MQNHMFERFCTEWAKKIETIYWRCAKAGCKSRLTTSLQYRQQQHPLVSSGVQMHPLNPAEMAIQRIENTVKAAANTLKCAGRYLEGMAGICSLDVELNL